MSGFVYAIECSNRIKIGFSEDPERRLNKIASDAPFPCELLGYWPGTIADELDVHEKFRNLRLHGEWFAASVLLLEFISTVAVAKGVKPIGMTKFLGFDVPRGTQNTIAKTLGITPGAVCQWRATPPEHVLKVEEITGISKHVLRPDVFGAEEEAA